MAQELQAFTGKMTYNIVNLVKNGTKKIFNGYIILPDENGAEQSYKVVSFRTQVIYQSEVLGEKGMAGKNVTIHGVFKENVWNGQTTFQLMAEKIFIEGMDRLALEAEQSGSSLPQSPGGTLHTKPAKPAGAIIANQQQQVPSTGSQIPQYVPAAIQSPVTPTAPTAPTKPVPPQAPHIVIDSSIHPTKNTLTTPMAPTPNNSKGPKAIAGGFVAPSQEPLNQVAPATL